uniref:Mitotic spindle assembly checkpoint protein MAD1 n=1 Tax=Takifugu rubripes TaxID=31033 RepID=A0A674PJI0_TAKRU
MDLEDDTTVLTTLKSFNSFISRTEPQQRLTERPGSGTLQGQYKRSMELLEAADRLNSTNRYLQLDQEKKQMELSHKRARFELEKTASDRTRALEHEVDRNQELLTQIKKLKERESEMERNLTEKGDANRALWKNLEALNKKLEDRDGRLSSANQTVSTLKDEVRELKQKIQNQDCTICAQTLENQELQEQLDLQRRKYQDVSQLYQSLQATQSTCSDHVIKIKELERRLALQEQDVAIMKTVKSELARVPGMEKELKNLRGDNSFLRENCSLLKEEVEGLRKKLERMEKMKEDLVNMELEKNVKSPIIKIIVMYLPKKQHFTLLIFRGWQRSSKPGKIWASLPDSTSELSEQRGKTLEEKKKRELQDTLVRRLQKRLMLLNKERDGMRAILESYDSELGSTEYSPQLSKRLKEAEDVLQRTQNHNVELEVRDPHSNAPHLALTPLQDCWSFRQKIEDLEADRQRLEEQNNNLEMRLERHNLQGDYDPLKTRVLHLKMNPTSVAKQQRQQEMETIQEEVTRLRELVRSLQDGGSLVQSQDDSIVPNLGLGLPPSKEVLDLRKQMESSELKNQRLKEVFQRKIQEFRTVCYILTGYQMDITTENQYRLTSVYAEHMDDSLLFKKGSNGSMQLMETEFSKTLGEMVSLHLHHQKSIPAFLSAVTLDLFSRQTTI